jgi:hypothetical protein
VREGYAERPREEQDEQAEAGSGGGSGPRGSELARLERARRVLGLDNRPLTLPVLKSRYKRLMKQYHPDVNPAGLARCQEITAAYSVVVSSL